MDFFYDDASKSGHFVHCAVPFLKSQENQSADALLIINDSLTQGTLRIISIIIGITKKWLDEEFKVIL